ncbi:MAG: hypothetical protein ABW321_01560 [Polyangiales bacterium]
MRTTCWAASLLWVFSGLACAPQPSAPRPVTPPRSAAAVEGKVSSATHAGTTVLRIERGAQPVDVAVERDASVAAETPAARVDVIGWTDQAVVVVDTYPSVPGGMSLCQAGEERFLRVVALSERSARLTQSLKLESCRQSIELQAPPAWDAQRRTLDLRWLQPHPVLDRNALTIRFDTRGALLPAD